jgi:hypothetical protein
MNHHTFQVEVAEGHPVVSFTILQHAGLNDVIEAFEQFLKAVGYSLPEGCILGYEEVEQ